MVETTAMPKPTARPSSPTNSGAMKTAREYWLGVLKRERIEPDRAEQQIRLWESAGNNSKFGRSLVETLHRQMVVGSEVIARAVAERHQLQLIKLEQLQGSAERVAKIGYDKCLHHYALPLAGQEIRFAIADPEMNGWANFRATLRNLFQTSSFEVCIASIDDISQRLDEIRQAQRKPAEIELQESRPTAQLVEQDLERAYRLGASDMHLKPGESSHTITARVDGVCREIRRISGAENKAAYISLLKLSSGRGLHGEDRSQMPEAVRTRAMESDNQYEAQDSASVREYGGRRVALRYSSIPSPRGESLAVRLIDHTKILSMSLGDLGYLPEDEKLLSETFRGSMGLNAFLGITGSGKTTSLYCGMKEGDMNGLRTVTIEDPIECLFSEGPIQIEVTPQLSFETLCEKVLRHDPDTIVVSEVRSKITAQVLTWATMSGHLTFTTWHAATPFVAIHRLMGLDLQIRDFASVIDVFCAQTLARRICEKCRQPHPRNGELIEEHKALLERHGVADPHFFHKKVGGCEYCKNRGDKGRMVLAELYKFDDGDRDQIIKEKEQYNVVLARRRAMERKHRPLKTMRQDAIVKAALGMLSYEEALIETQKLTDDSVQHCDLR